MMLQSDNVVSDAAKSAGLTLEGLGITPELMQAIAPQYLGASAPPGSSSA